MNHWGPFEHLIWKNFINCGLEGRERFVLPVSGGLDSMVLLHVVKKLKPAAVFKILHYHHGSSRKPEQQSYRNQVVEFLQNRESVIVEKAVDLLSSEQEMREARWSFIRRKAEPGEIILTGHHLDDRLETILLKLVRGSSLEGISAFQMWNGKLFRPLLNVSKLQLLDYAQINKLEWKEDPSNQDPAYLRNWLREVWLPQLEQRLAGGTKNMARSLLNIVDQSSQSRTFELVFEGEAISRDWFKELENSEQLRALAQYLKLNGIISFSTGQLEEIRKRLDKNQKDITFELLGKKWVINAMQIMIR